MRMSSFSSPRRARTRAGIGVSLACVAASMGAALPPGAQAQAPATASATVAALPDAAAAPADGQSALGDAAAVKPDATAALEGCISASAQAERSATFTGEMTAIPGSTKMEMRIEVLERLPGEPAFEPVIAPGLGVWRTAAPGVKVYRFLKQVTNLSAPAVYRGAVAFRWINARGRAIKYLELRTPRCSQAAGAPTPTSTSGASSSSTGP